MTWEPERVRQAVREYDALHDENHRLRELVDGLLYCAHEAYGMCARAYPGSDELMEKCPLYDLDAASPYRCEELMVELGFKEGK